jgi:3-deoxy-D-manno-octulosonic-acid transferase
LIAIYYYFVFVVLLLVWPVLLFKKKTRAGLGQKLGFIPAAIKSKSANLKGCVWFHAVSVGEFNAIFHMVKGFHLRHPYIPLVISTTTETGQKLARERLGEIATIIYFPFDLPGAITAWMKCLKPALVVIAETEIWPGFTHVCKKRGVKVMVVNGRMSPKSFRSYLRNRWLFKPVLERFSVIGVQSPEEAERYRAVGGDKLNIAVLGNIKFDGLEPVAKEVTERLEKTLNIGPAGSLALRAHQYGSGLPPVPVLVAGSTHDLEEVCVLKAYAQLLDTAHGGRARLVIVPRHPERFDKVAELIKEYDFIPRRYSRREGFELDLPGATGAKVEVYLLDVIGQLFDFYSLASVAFVGGTLAPVGGHNIMEPYAYGVPVVVGPRTEKVRDLMLPLTSQQAILQGKNEASIIAHILDLFADEQKRTEVGLAGRKILTDSQGAVAKALDLIELQLVDENLKGIAAAKDAILEEVVRGD